MRFAHGEGLARQHAVEYNAAEQVVLGDVRQDEAEVALLLGERDDNVRAVDKVDLDVLVLGEEGVQAGLDGRDRDGPLRVLDNEYAVLLLRRRTDRSVRPRSPVCVVRNMPCSPVPS